MHFYLRQYGDQSHGSRQLFGGKELFIERVRKTSLPAKHIVRFWIASERRK